MKVYPQNYQRCTNGLWDTSVPGINFDENGVSNYAKMFLQLCEMYPRGEIGQKKWEAIISEIKAKGQGRKYDCIIGVSGGTDSSYLLHLAKKVYGLRPLAVNLDNGWNSDIAVQNIKKVTNALDIDLETYVIDYEEIKDLLRSYLFAKLPWIDMPTDLAIKSILMKIARKENVKFVLRGNDFRSEGFQPREWTYGDGKQLKYLHEKYGKVRLNTYPNYTIWGLFADAFLAKVKNYFPFYYIEYDKSSAREFLIKEFGWQYYGGHHYENIFTKFVMSYWLYEIFGIDKRIISLSAQIMSGHICREDALNELKEKPYDPEEIDKVIKYLLKKLDLSLDDFNNIIAQPNHWYTDYPNNYELLRKLTKYLAPIINLVYPYKTISMIQMDNRKD